MYAYMGAFIANNIVTVRNQNGIVSWIIEMFSWKCNDPWKYGTDLKRWLLFLFPHHVAAETMLCDPAATMRIPKHAVTAMTVTATPISWKGNLLLQEKMKHFFKQELRLLGKATFI